jgi:hypothetical protein
MRDVTSDVAADAARGIVDQKRMQGGPCTLWTRRRSHETIWINGLCESRVGIYIGGSKTHMNVVGLWGHLKATEQCIHEVRGAGDTLDGRYLRRSVLTMAGMKSANDLSHRPWTTRNYNPG